MPRNAYLTLKCVYDDFRKNWATTNDNEWIPYKILTILTKAKFIHITYTYECGFVKTSCFRTS
ncbi:hypothetical protein HanRHA438_Chr04g0170931 [Helianthus annuus]|uniref:Uncharacterized protein n=1 Tax=Helianthus annuus TaxID=4232 RepID=A0A9K3J7A4_HELAN|nr:hypothetical protein HanXRQr2_Chr04g0160741 [Helianthus annuus]KAJ0588354.1 hypothetical protein HanIR_Chr04g0173681 [Helianthus annuus]KAJ0926418.1 hypothetical protein HanRHA438_Chr04g0170931 [Helianthus annuus]KAJ0930890.1 hypothetical protein HanPSC8_Chr04g0154811 [Helianthus annuus]